MTAAANDHGFSPRLIGGVIAVGIVAFIALWRYKVGIITVIAACGVAGLAWTFGAAALGF
jgi:chromate transporter